MIVGALRLAPRRRAALAAVAALLASACGGSGGGGSGGGGSPGGDRPPALRASLSRLAGGDVDAAHAVTVSIVDDAGRLAPSFAATVTLSLAAGPPGAALGGVLAAAAAHGVATFSVTLRTAGEGYVLRAAAPGVAAGESAPFALAPGAPATLAFVAQPADAVAGVPPGPVAVRIDDAWGNPTSSASRVDLAAAPGSAGPVLGIVSAVAVAGVARFTDLRLERAGVHALRATSAGLAPATSSLFAVAPAAAAALRVDGAPGAAVAGEPFQVIARLVDAFGNDTADTGVAVRAALSPPFAPLLGTTAVTSVNGAATFAALSVERARAAVAVTVSADGLAGAASERFDVAAGAASGLGFTAEPHDAVAGAVLSPVRVAVVDLYGNLRPDAASAISLALDPAGPPVRGALTRAAVDGVATFADLSVTVAGTGYSLRATSPGLADARSAAFSVAPGDAAALAFTASPRDAVAGAVLSPVEVVALDAFGNPAPPATPQITLSLPGAALLGTTVATPDRGVARFADLRLERAGAHTLRATSGALAPATSDPFVVSPAAPDRLAFATEPTTTAVGVAIAPPVVVAILDAYENRTDAAATVVVTVASTTAPGGDVEGTLATPAVAGLATFSDLRPTAVGTYALAASSDGVAPASSASFEVRAPRAALAYTEGGAGRIALRRSPASTDSTAVLELVALEPFAGYSVAMNLPVDRTRVAPGAPLFEPGDALALGTGIVAAGAALPSAGPLAGVVVSGASQKAEGGGAVPTDADVPAGAVLYTLRLEAAPDAPAGVVFDGAAVAADPRFRAAVRDRAGNEVVPAAGFAIGRLEVVIR